MNGGRDAALEALTACRRLDAWSDAGLKAACRGLDRREAALASALCYGVLQNRALLDFYLDFFCGGRFGRLEPFVRDALRLGAYQIVFMDRVPDRAAVSEAVEMVKRRRRQRAAGLVNAVLRRLSGEKDSLPPLPAGDRTEYLALRYSHPAWLVRRLTGLLGEEEAEAFLRLDNEPAPATIQRNPLRCTEDALLESLRSAGAEVALHPWLEGCYTLSGAGDLAALPAFRSGWFLVQDAGARLAALACGVRPGDRVLDVCAAPGGKSFALAMETGDACGIAACDIHPHKLALIEKGAARLGLAGVRACLADGRENNAAWNGAFDLVLCDVPCSGLGVVRKKPDVRYKDPDRLRGLPAVQSAILANAGRYVRPGGTLVYVTCTVLPEENGGVTGAFLGSHGDFRPEPFALPGPVGETDGETTLWPQRCGTDGFYICKMRKL